LAADYLIREVAPGDIDQLDAHLRQPDRDEIVASHGADTRRTIADAVVVSTHCLAIETKGRLACLLGVAPLAMAAGIGSPWMLGTDVLDYRSRTLARVARRYFDEVARVYPVLENHVDVRNAASIKLLKWLGCSFDAPKPYGVAGLPFMRFERRSA
jgi:hypothetical protein